MAFDDIQAGLQTGTGPDFAGNTVSGKLVPAGSLVYITGGSPGAYTCQVIDATHGLPIVSQTGATWAVTGTFWQTTQPVSIAGTVTIAFTAPQHVILDSGTLTTVTTVTTVSAVTAITNALPAGTNLLGKVGIDQTTPGATNLVATNPAKGTPTPTVLAPNTTAALMLAANAARKSALFVNNGSVTIYLGPTGGVTVANSGIPLYPGASLMDTDTLSAWYGITASGTGDLRVVEVV